MVSYTPMTQYEVLSRAIENGREKVIVPATTEPLKFTVTLECHFEPSKEKVNVSRSGDMYDPSRVEVNSTLASTIQRYIAFNFDTLRNFTDNIHVNITDCPDSWYNSHNEAMRQIKEIKEKKFSDKQKRLLAQESELRAKLAEIEKLKNM